MSNDFYDAVVVYDFEDVPGFLVSSVGNPQTLSQRLAPFPVLQDGVIYKVGTESASPASPPALNFSELRIDDGDLDTGFPFKVEPGYVQDLTACFWMRLDNGATGANGLIYKADSASSKAAFVLTYSDGVSGFNIVIEDGQEGHPVYNYSIGAISHIDNEVWYHITFRYTTATDIWTLDVWNFDTSSNVQYTDTSTVTMGDTVGTFSIGNGLAGSVPMQGNIDEVVVFGAVKTDDDIDDIIDDNYGPLKPEINITGNGITILSGDVTPSGTDGTDFGNAGIS